VGEIRAAIVRECSKEEEEEMESWAIYRRHRGPEFFLFLSLSLLLNVPTLLPTLGSESNQHSSALYGCGVD